jgi:hypothetical protein
MHENEGAKGIYPKPLRFRKSTMADRRLKVTEKKVGLYY